MSTDIRPGTILVHDPSDLVVVSHRREGLSAWSLTDGTLLPDGAVHEWTVHNLTVDDVAAIIAEQPSTVYHEIAVEAEQAHAKHAAPSLRSQSPFADRRMTVLVGNSAKCPRC